MSRRAAPAMSTTLNRVDRAALVMVVTAATLCLALAALISTDSWAAFFAHPLVDSSLTVRGAGLWRVMLAVSAVALPAALVAIRALSSPASRAAEAVPSTSDRTRLFLMAGLIVAG